MRKESHAEPQVGIFWLIGDRLIIDSTPLSAAEPYGDCLNHPQSHIDYWTEHQSLGDLPRETEYEKHPRGRVVFHSKTERYSLCADRCILRRKSVVERIIKAMHLPIDLTDILTDSHYRCFRCLERESERNERDGE
jgi:hypothetical protein